MVPGWPDRQVQHQPYTMLRTLVLTALSPREPRNPELELKEVTFEQNLQGWEGEEQIGILGKQTVSPMTESIFVFCFPQVSSKCNTQHSKLNGKGKVNKIKMGSGKRAMGTHRERQWVGELVGAGGCLSLGVTSHPTHSLPRGSPPLSQPMVSRRRRTWPGIRSSVSHSHCRAWWGREWSERAPTWLPPQMLTHMHLTYKHTYAHTDMGINTHVCPNGIAHYLPSFFPSGSS